MPSGAFGNATAYWGPPSSTIDWCEGNYLVTPYVAEFCNSTSSLFIVAAGVLPLALHYQLWSFLEARYLLAFLSVAVVGLGSVAFHGTLLFRHQMLDEVPMLWTVVVVLYCLIEHGEVVPKFGPMLPLGLAVYASVATYATSQQGGNAQWFSFHTMFAACEFTALFMTVRFFRRLDESEGQLRTLLKQGFAAYVGAVAVWLVDLNFCTLLLELPGYSFWNLHAFGWHLLVSCGLYSMMLGMWYHRLRRVLGKEVRLSNGLIPRILSGKAE